MPDPLAPLDIFHGEATPSVGRVYARLPASAELDGCELAGEVTGPVCRRARTLSASVRFAHRPSGGGLLAEAVLPDPCFWSDELPMLYTAHIELRRGRQVLAASERLFGFRAIGPRGHSLFREGKRWVPRGAFVASVVEQERGNLERWREAGAVRFGPVDEALCRAASELGIWLIADLATDGATLASATRWPAVFMAVLPEGQRATAAMREASPNVLIAHRVPLPHQAADKASGVADALFCPVPSLPAPPEFAAAAASAKLPIIVERKLHQAAAIAEARRACDCLQRDLAPIGDFAGYLV